MLIDRLLANKKKMPGLWKMIKGYKLHHVFIWILIYAIWILIFTTEYTPVNTVMKLSLCYLVFIAASFYTVSYYLSTKYLYKGNYSRFFFGFVIVNSVASVLLSICLYWTYERIQPGGSYIKPLQFLYGSLMSVFFAVGSGTAVKIIIDRFGSQQRTDRAEKDKITSELNFLKAQINPHFIFNSLNTIYFQIDQSAESAREALLKFADILRY